MKSLCRGSGAGVGGRIGASNRGKSHPCPICGRMVGMRPGRRGTIYNHWVKIAAIHYIPIPVLRPNAGGELWAVGYVINNRDFEKGETPSHSREIIQKRCEQLNRSQI